MMQAAAFLAGGALAWLLLRRPGASSGAEAAPSEPQAAEVEPEPDDDEPDWGV